MEATRVTKDELAENLVDIMERVIVNREHFCVVDGDTVVAEIKPGPKGLTVADFRREFGDLKVPEGLGADIEDARKVLAGLPDVQ